MQTQQELLESILKKYQLSSLDDNKLYTIQVNALKDMIEDVISKAYDQNMLRVYNPPGYLDCETRYVRKFTLSLSLPEHPNKINNVSVMKLIRHLSGCTLKQAKEVLKSFPCDFMSCYYVSDLEPNDLTKIKGSFEAIGVIVNIRSEKLEYNYTLSFQDEFYLEH